jgi:hypothetical protein
MRFFMAALLEHCAGKGKPDFSRRAALLRKPLDPSWAASRKSLNFRHLAALYDERGMNGFISIG